MVKYWSKRKRLEHRSDKWWCSAYLTQMCMTQAGASYLSAHTGSNTGSHTRQTIEKLDKKKRSCIKDA